LSPMKVVLAGGGTGGHAYPALSVGQALREAHPQVELLFVGSSHGPERELASAAGIAFEAVPSSPLTKSTRGAAVGRLIVGIVRARRILNRFGADVVMGTGGHAAAAVVIAQRTRRGRIVIQEQNAIPGRTNLWLSRFADKICVTVESSAACFPAGKVVVTGMPIRREFASLPDKADARRALGLREDLFTIVIVGGSQGAKRINELMLAAWPRICDGETQVLHQVGRLNIDEMRDKAAEDYRVEPVVDMPLALASADLVIGRSGASTLAEITAAGTPSVLIPYPYAYADHQRLNAEELEKRGAAIVRIESDLTAESLADLIVDMRSAPDRLRAMSAASKACGKPAAAARVAQVVMGTS
jgi:UDP-N-acetylglucosamine--N-acetylmuramyl-(pentapeptide) pyrophosphoryl-undecaprenol N-acetylglucosamine transferase